MFANGLEPEHPFGNNFFKKVEQTDFDQIKRSFVEPSNCKLEFDRQEVLELKVDTSHHFKYSDVTSVDGTGATSTQRLTVKDHSEEDQISSIHANFSDDLHHFIQEAKTTGTSEDNDSQVKKRGRKKTTNKLFSRRKDVIIKTLLRKCRRFFQKEFNLKTNYLKLKRKMDASFYRVCLAKYIRNELNFEPTDELIIFLGALLYQQDLEKAIDTFVTPGFDVASIKKELEIVHEILYKYSHEKFRAFTKQKSEFGVFFSVYYSTGADADRVDPEYEQGLEIIKEQL